VGEGGVEEDGGGEGQQRRPPGLGTPAWKLGSRSITGTAKKLHTIATKSSVAGPSHQINHGTQDGEQGHWPKFLSEKSGIASIIFWLGE
jgi:hypothetical protein